MTRISEIEHSEKQSCTTEIPSVGWAMGNIISLATVSENDFMDTQESNSEMFYVLYVRVIVTLAENLLSHVEKVGAQDIHLDFEATPDETEKGKNNVKISFVELIRPVCQQWHLAKLLAASGKETRVIADKDASTSSEKGSIKFCRAASNSSSLKSISTSSNIALQDTLARLCPVNFQIFFHSKISKCLH